MIAKSATEQKYEPLSISILYSLVLINKLRKMTIYNNYHLNIVNESKT